MKSFPLFLSRQRVHQHPAWFIIGTLLELSSVDSELYTAASGYSYYLTNYFTSLMRGPDSENAGHAPKVQAHSKTEKVQRFITKCHSLFRVTRLKNFITCPCSLAKRTQPKLIAVNNFLVSLSLFQFCSSVQKCGATLPTNWILMSHRLVCSSAIYDVGSICIYKVRGNYVFDSKVKLDIRHVHWCFCRNGHETDMQT